MRFTEDGLEFFVVVVIMGGLIAFGATFFAQYLDKARLTLSVAAMQDAQEALKAYRGRTQTYPQSLDFGDCSDQDDLVVLSCDAIKGDIEGFVSYAGTGETFVLKAEAKDSNRTLITVTESAISY